jgi:hypothetical protein
LGAVSIRFVMLPSFHGWLTGNITPLFEASL